MRALERIGGSIDIGVDRSVAGSPSFLADTVPSGLAVHLRPPQ
ncbi:hypothetical protein QOZ88_08175 [Blastococcus sp. BMG 814]|uniref:Uncharacterized protein n=1 Tax=Blastococcus carthaginiensis TaxID=3050034 RepID=A0ABT9IAM4_9ACTN|nr:hypothetical protein [Blastococcus carthaginiensis]MDP5182614.1 hypothetical protein [Blastococcus carthaginiensis]